MAVLKDYAVSGREPPRRIPSDMLQKMMSAGVGQMVPEEYIPLLVEETRLGEEDTRAVRWQRDPARLGIDAFKVVVIGAGFAGLCAAIRLKELGIPFEILEKNEGVGGTWLENDYPGCAVDTPNHFYSSSFNSNNKWSRHFSQRDEILAYIEATAAKYDLCKYNRFGTEATIAEFDEVEARWRITARERDGSIETIDCNAVITAVGQLNRPSVPRSPGCPCSVARSSIPPAGTGPSSSRASASRCSAPARALFRRARRSPQTSSAWSCSSALRIG